MDDYMEEMKPQYVEYMLKEIEQAKNDVSADNWEAARAWGHKVKGDVSGLLGFDTINELGRNFEQAAKNQDKEKALELLEKIEGALKE